MKPKVFIASSVESLEIAEWINVNLDYNIAGEIWKDAFHLSSMTLPTLIDKAKSSEFGIFVFGADDKLEMRGADHDSVRDNVIFELGLFIGLLGPERCFIVKPRFSNLHIPTDLAGVTIADYDNNRPKDELESSLNAPCTKIKKAISSITASDLTKYDNYYDLLPDGEIKQQTQFKVIKNSNSYKHSFPICFPSSVEKIELYINNVLSDGNKFIKNNDLSSVELDLSGVSVGEIIKLNALGK